MFATRIKKKTNKYGNEKVVFDGITFDSKKEFQRYLFLKDAMSKGIISELKCHPSYELIPKQTKKETVHLKTKDKTVDKLVFRPITFSPDFVYNKDGEIVAEDVKGSKMMISADFPLRQKLLYYRYGIYVNIVTKPTSQI